MPPIQQQLDQDAVNLAKAIRQTESGGNFEARGKSGEYGAYQFTTPTWQKTAAKYGIRVPLTSATKEQQNEVTYKQIKEWKDQGFNVGQIASMWNAGEGKPNAYKDGLKGTNKYGANYDVQAYAKSVATAYQTIKRGGVVGIDPNNPSSINAPQAYQEKPSALGFVGNLIGSTGRLIGGTASALANVLNPNMERNTIANIANLGAGALQTGIRKLTGTQIPRTQEEQQFGAVKDFYKERYGGVENVKKTIYEDPAGVAADASIVLGGGAALASKAGQAAKLPALSRAGSALSKAAEISNPLLLPAKGLNKLVPTLQKSAEKSYTDILAPTGKGDKFRTKGIVEGRSKTLSSGEQIRIPGLRERGIVAGSREGLLQKVQTQKGATGQALKQAEKKLPATDRLDVQPILDDIEKAKAKFVIQGESGPVVADPAAIQNLDDFAKTVSDLTAEGQVSPQSLTQLKRLWQEKVNKSGAYIGKTLAEGSKVDMLSEAENAIRRQLDNKYPDIAKINAEYSFWKNAETVLQNTIQRKTGQTGLLRKGLAYGTGALVGTPLGVGGVAGGALLTNLAVELFSSPAWKSVSAIMKNRLANLIARGKVEQAAELMRKLLPVTQANRPLLDRINKESL